MPNELYVFDAFTLDVTERRLANGSHPVALEPKTFDVLTTLVRNAGRLVTKQLLLDEIWSGSFVAEGILSVHVARLRTALGGGEGSAVDVRACCRLRFSKCRVRLRLFRKRSLLIRPMRPLTPASRSRVARKPNCV